MQVAVSGATGLVGSALLPALAARGDTVRRLVRSATRPGAGTIAWEPDAGRIDAAALEGTDVVVHLAGESIAQRWNDDVKRRIRESRVRGTRLLAESLAQMRRRPSVLVCASAVGFYGPRGDEPLDETSPGGKGFLAEVCRAWEDAADPARAAGIRVVHARFGVILSTRGGALAKMLTPFRMGVGGVVGTGRQVMSWVALEDVVLALQHAIGTAALAGPANFTAPEPVTNREFTKTLGRALHRPTVFPLPAFAARAAFGEMADALLLTGQRVLPRRLEETGFRFRHPHLDEALRSALSS